MKLSLGVVGGLLLGLAVASPQPRAEPGNLRGLFTTSAYF